MGNEIIPGFHSEMTIRPVCLIGVPLTAAEKLQAVSSPIANWVGDLVQAFTPNNEHGLSQYIQWDISRGKPLCDLTAPECGNATGRCFLQEEAFKILRNYAFAVRDDLIKRSS